MDSREILVECTTCGKWQPCNIWTYHYRLGDIKCPPCWEKERIRKEEDGKKFMNKARS